MQFVNLTPHAVVLNNGKSFPTSGMVARVLSFWGKMDENGIMPICWSNVENLPEPIEGTIFIVSAIVAARVTHRSDIVAPATGHKDCKRDERGQIISVPGFVKIN